MASFAISCMDIVYSLSGKKNPKSLIIASDLFLGSSGSEMVTIPLCSYMYSIFTCRFLYFLYTVLTGISLIILVYNPNSSRNMCRYVFPSEYLLLKYFSMFSNISAYVHVLPLCTLRHSVVCCLQYWKEWSAGHAWVDTEKRAWLAHSSRL